LSESKNFINTIKEKANNSAEVYSQSATSRALLNTIPYIGSSIDAWISTKAENIFKNRVTKTIEALTEEIEKVGNNINKKFLESEDFFDLLLIYMEKCVRTRNIDKVRINSKILVGSLVVDNSGGNDFAEDMLNKFADLNPNDIKLASFIYEKQKEGVPLIPKHSDAPDELQFVNSRNWDTIQNEASLDKLEFNLALLKLSQAGLIKEVMGSYIGYFGGKYIITDIFRKLMQFISYANEPLYSSKITNI